MARGKVHKFAGTVSGDGTTRELVLCGQWHRKLLPLLHTNEWRAVTCARCLTHRPQESRTLRERLWALINRLRGRA